MIQSDKGRITEKPEKNQIGKASVALYQNRLARGGAQRDAEASMTGERQLDALRLSAKVKRNASQDPSSAVIKRDARRTVQRESLFDVGKQSTNVSTQLMASYACIKRAHATTQLVPMENS